MRRTLFSERLVVRLHCHGKQLTVAPAVAKRHHITVIHIGHSLPQSSHLLCAIPDGEIPDWCPLRELPEKMPNLEHGYENVEKSIIRTGWNACLDAIAKE